MIGCPAARRVRSATARAAWALAALLPAAAVLGAPPAAGAQERTDSILPRAGAWGAEASLGGFSGTSLLKFTKPRAAWVVGAAFYARHDEAAGDGVVLESRTSGYVALRLGRRWWRGGAGDRVQPLLGAGAFAQLSRPADPWTGSGGAYAEVGTTYFFTPHVSLGTSAEVRGNYARYQAGNDAEGPIMRGSWTLEGTLVRFAGAVYF